MLLSPVGFSAGPMHPRRPHRAVCHRQRKKFRNLRFLDFLPHRDQHPPPLLDPAPRLLKHAVAAPCLAMRKARPVLLCCALLAWPVWAGSGGGDGGQGGDGWADRPAGAGEGRCKKLASWRRRAAQEECAKRFANSVPDGEGGCRCAAGYMLSSGQCVPNDASRGGGRGAGACQAGDGTAAEQADLYARDPGRFDLDNDYEAAGRLARALAAASLCSRDNVVLIGGLNEGQLARRLLQDCAVTAHGVEIQRQLAHFAREQLRQCCPSATVHHLGWSNRNSERVRVAALGGYGGLYSAEKLAASVRPDGRPHMLSRHASAALQQETEWEQEGGGGSFTDTVALGDWVEAELGLGSILYVAIDAEGHEARIIEGMGLEDEPNRQRFAAFQFEVGGTWAERDPRRAVPSWSLEDTAKFLHHCEYELYLIGDNVHMRVFPQFFVEAAILDEGFGPFVRGNVLALHRQYVHPAIREHVLRSLLRPRPDLCGG